MATLDGSHTKRRVVAVTALFFAVLMVMSPLGYLNFSSGNGTASATSASPGIIPMSGTYSGGMVSVSNTTSYIPGGSSLLSGINLSMQTTVFLGFHAVNRSKLNSYLNETSSPSSSLYRHYMTHSTFERYFEPSASSVDTVASYYRQMGLTITPQNDRLYLQISGSLLQIEKAFNTSFSMYNTSLGTYYFNTQDVQVPTAFSGMISGVIGFSNYPYFTPALTVNPALGMNVTQAIGVINSGAGGATNQPPYSPGALQLAYNETGLLSKGYTGAYETVVVIDAYGDPTAQVDMATYDGLYNMPAPPSFQTIYPYGTASAYTDAGSVTSLWEVESALDFQMAHATAPGANIVAAVSPDAGYTLLQTLAYVITNQLGNVVSNSWGEPEQEAGTAVAYMNPFFQMAAAEGITVLAASGDQGAAGYDPSVPRSVMWPCTDPYVTAVGGTTLFMNGTVATGVGNPLNGPPTVPEVVNPTGWQNETAWDGYTGGGYSVLYARPFWQTGPGLPTSGPDSNMRGSPDVAANAMFGGNDFVFNGQPGGSQLFGGTSFASPIWAGVIATMDSYTTAIQGDQLGFLNPTFYEILNSKAYSKDFHDILYGYNGPNGFYNAGPGWSPVTGMGSPNIGNLATELVDYTFSTGVKGDFRTTYNHGVSANIQTVVPQRTMGTSVNQYYVEDTLASGTMLMAGYAIDQTYKSGTWFFEIIPSTSAFGTYNVKYGGDGSAGSNGTFNNYAIMETSPGVWSILINSRTVVTVSDVSTSSGRHVPYFAGSTSQTTSSFNILGPSVISGMDYYNGSAFLPIPSAMTFEGTTISSSYDPSIAFNNPYGVSIYTGTDFSVQHSIIVGSGVPLSNGQILWGSYQNIPPKTVLLKNPEYVTLYAQHVDSVATAGGSSFQLTTQFPTGQKDFNNFYLVPVLGTSTWSFVTSESTSSSLTLAGNQPIFAHFYVEASTLNSSSIQVGPPLTVTVSLTAGGTLIGTGSVTQSIPASGGIVEYNVSFLPVVSSIPANAYISMSISWYIASAAGEQVSYAVAPQTGQQYPILLSLPTYNPVDVSPLILSSGTAGLYAESHVSSPFGKYDLASINATVNGVQLSSAEVNGNVYTWFIPQMQLQTGTNVMSVTASDLQGLFNTASATYSVQSTKYSLTFQETGLPSGTTWGVDLSGNEVTTHGSSLTVYLPGGRYAYSTTGVQGYRANPSSDTVSLTSSTVVPIQFSPRTYSVSFGESGLPAGSQWNVTIGSMRESSTTGTVTFQLVNGTYTYTVGRFNGFSASTYSGTFTVSGKALVEPDISWTRVLYYANFTASGLPSGTSWTVSLAGVTTSSSESLISFAVGNGTYAYKVMGIAGYSASSYSGTVHVAGSSADTAIAWSQVDYIVTFSENGLPSSAQWGVTVNGISTSGDSQSIISTLPNGTYQYTVQSVGGYTVSPSSGSVTVNGHDVSISVTYSSSPRFMVTFSEQGLPSGTTWSVAFNGIMEKTNGNQISFETASGSYQYTVSSVPGYAASSHSGTITVSGANTAVTIVWKPVTYAVTFNETGLPPETSWSVSLGGTSLSSTNSSITFQVVNGTYSYSVSSSGLFQAQNSRGNVNVNGSGVTISVIFTPTSAAGSQAVPLTVVGLAGTGGSGGITAVVAARKHLMRLLHKILHR